MYTLWTSIAINELNDEVLSSSLYRNKVYNKLYIRPVINLPKSA